MSLENTSIQPTVLSVTYKYLYNAFNERIYKEKTSSNTSTNSYEYTFAETGGAPLLQVDLQNSSTPLIKQSYIQGLNLAAHEEYSTNNTTSLIFHLYDHLGNTRVTYEAEPDPEVCTNITYNVVSALDYYPYGKTHRKYVAGNAERYLTTGNERDAETDYDYRMARFSDADIGRFLSVDPMADKYYASSPYNYVDGNPVMRTDPYGDDWFQGDRTGEIVWRPSDKKNLQMIGEDGKMQNWTNMGTTATFIDPETGYKTQGNADGSKTDLGAYELKEARCVAERNKPGDNSTQNKPPSWDLYGNTFGTAAGSADEFWGSKKTTYYTKGGELKDIRKPNGAFRSARSANIAKGLKVLKIVGVAGNVFSVGVAANNIIEAKNKGEDVATKDVLDLSIGTAGLAAAGTTALVAAGAIVASPVIVTGAAIVATGAAIYGIGSAVYDLWNTVW